MRQILSNESLSWLPIGLFGAVMGLCGLAQAWNLASSIWSLPSWIATAIGVGASLIFMTLLFAFIFKWACNPKKLRQDLSDPVTSVLYATPLISALLLPTIWVDYFPNAARILWLTGAIGMVSFAWYILGRWLLGNHNLSQVSPTWIIPIVGMLDIPLAAKSIGFANFLPELSILALAVGLGFTLPLLSILLARLVFDSPLPAATKPSLMILLAPFSVGFSAYVEVRGSIDLFAQGLLSITIFLLPILIIQLKNLPVYCPFRVSWWSVSFPLAASVVAILKFSLTNKDGFISLLAAPLLILVTTVFIWLLVRTLTGLITGELRRI